MIWRLAAAWHTVNSNLPCKLPDRWQLCRIGFVWSFCCSVASLLRWSVVACCWSLGHLPLGKGSLVSRWSDLPGFAKPDGLVVLETRRNPLIPAGLFEIGFVWYFRCRRLLSGLWRSTILSCVSQTASCVYSIAGGLDFPGQRTRSYLKQKTLPSVTGRLESGRERPGRSSRTGASGIRSQVGKKCGLLKRPRVWAKRRPGPALRDFGFMSKSQARD